MVATYEVRLSRDENGAWLAKVPSVPGCHTHGRSIELGRDGSAPTRAVLARTLAREFGITRVRPSR